MTTFDSYASRYAVVAHIDGANPNVATPAEYAAMPAAAQAEADIVLSATAAKMLDNLRAIAAVSEWSAELQARTVIEVEAMLAAP